MVYADIVKQALRGLKPSNLGTRRTLYEQLRAGLKSTLEDGDPPIDRRDKDIELRLLETTIRRFETDLRAGIDVMAEAYAPEELEAEQNRLYALKVISRVAAAPAVTTLEEKRASIADLKLQMRELSIAAPPEISRESPLRPAMLCAIVLRYINDMAASQGRMGLLWILVEPIMLVGLTICIYLLLDQRFIMNMDLIPFSIMGVLAWLLIRINAVRVATAVTSGSELLALPPIRIVSIVICQGLAQFLLYTIALAIGLYVCVTNGHGEAPENWSLFCFYWFLLWVFGIATGLILAPLFLMFKASTRFVLIGTRLISWTSGLFFVSEQFPSDYKAFVLWNPLVHGVQLMRSAYFTQYETEDASLWYFMLSIGIVLVIAAASERVLAPRVEPA